jgi:hypothetical protein
MQNDNEDAVPIIEPSPTMNATQETSQSILPTASHPLFPKATIQRLSSHPYQKPISHQA